jgi:hypothetical protein
MINNKIMILEKKFAAKFGVFFLKLLLFRKKSKITSVCKKNATFSPKIGKKYNNIDSR